VREKGSQKSQYIFSLIRCLVVIGHNLAQPEARESPSPDRFGKFQGYPCSQSGALPPPSPVRAGVVSVGQALSAIVEGKVIILPD
jgi:hypothetical protein